MKGQVVVHLNTGVTSEAPCQELSSCPQPKVKASFISLFTDARLSNLHVWLLQSESRSLRLGFRV